MELTISKKKNEFLMKNIWKFLPIDIVHKILNVYKQIIYKNGVYTFINEIKVDYRHTLLNNFILKRKDVYMEKNNGGFYIEYHFSNGTSICWEYNYSWANKFEICYADWRNGDIIQLRTII